MEDVFATCSQKESMQYLASLLHVLARFEFVDFCILWDFSEVIHGITS